MDFARGKIRRRMRDACLLLAFAGLLALIGGTFIPGRDAKAATAPMLTIRYRTDTPDVASVAHPSLEVVNTSHLPVDLDAVTIRYYLSAKDGVQYAFNCVQAAVGCSNITGAIVTPPVPTPGADRYLQIGFAPGAGHLAPGQNSQDIQLQIWRLDHQNLSQGDDPSFNGDDADYTPSRRITAYLGGTLVWGVEPGSHAAPTGPPSSTIAQSASQTGAAQIPSGIVFDAFDYSGPDDPALGTHGWDIRTGSGGPGIHDSWSTAGVSFPAVSGVSGGQVLQLRAATDGTKAGTTQAELESVGMRFLNGTFAARVYFSPGPSAGKTGDPINEAFYLISAEAQAGYSELDTEYMPVGWGSLKGPVLDTTSWFDAKTKDRATQRHIVSLAGWHTIVITAADGQVTYWIDGKKVFTSSGKYIPHSPMSANFNAWYGDLFASGQRAWDMQVNWFYANAAQAMTPGDVDKAVTGLYAQGSTFIDTMPKP